MLQENITSGSRGWAIQTVVTTYATPAVPYAFAAATSFVSVSFPLWTSDWGIAVSAWDDAIKWTGKNTGKEVLNVVKVTLGESPLDTHVGFGLPKARPFMKGENEIEIVSLSTAYKCWMYGVY